MPRSNHLATALAACALLAACRESATAPLPPRDLIPTIGAGPLPFDTVGARRGPLPLSGPVLPTNARRLGGDTVVTATVQRLLYAPESVGPGRVLTREQWLGANVVARDTVFTRYDPRPVAFAPCPLVLRLVDGPGDGARVRWESSRSTQPCPATPNWRVRDVLGDSLPPHRYWFDYSVHLADGRELRYREGSAFLTGDTTAAVANRGQLRVRASAVVTETVPRNLVVRILVTNPTSRPVVAARDACGVQFRLRRITFAQAVTIWRTEWNCLSILQADDVHPGDTLEMRASYPVAEILGDSLAGGAHRVETDQPIHDDERQGYVASDPYPLLAGVVTLEREPASGPYPAPMRVAGSLRTESAARIVGDSVRVVVMVTNFGGAPTSLVTNAGDPMYVYAIRGDAAGRLTTDFVRDTPTWLATGSQLGRREMTLAPGERWVFERSIALATVRESLGPGRHALMAWIHGGTPLVVPGVVAVAP